MRILVANDMIKACWEHFSPMGLISLYGSLSAWTGEIYLVDLRRWDREYTKEEEEKIWKEVLQWAVSCPL